MTAIQVTNLVKRFGDLTALQGISFSVAKGETFGFLGPNGAGKTTTIRILTGISRPTSGTATIFGKNVVTDTIAARKEIGIVHETSNVYDDISAWRNLMFSAELYSIRKEERESRGRALLELFGLWDRRYDRVKGFSKGMKRRLTLAMGLINNPKLLFLDEPTSGLDVQSNLIIRDVIRDLNSKGVTVFLTTHNIEEANVTCDRVAIVNHGKIAAIDSPEKLKKTIESVQSLEVALEGNSNDIQFCLDNLPLVNEISKVGDKYRLITDDPPLLIKAIVECADGQNVRVISMNTYGPSLEDVFIKLTGLDIRTKGVTAID